MFTKTAKDRVQHKTLLLHSSTALWPESTKKKMRGKPVAGKAILILCMVSFLAGSLFTAQTSTWTHRSSTSNSFNKERHLQFISDKIMTLPRPGCRQNRVRFVSFSERMNNLCVWFWANNSQVLVMCTSIYIYIYLHIEACMQGEDNNSEDIMGEVTKTHQAIQ